MLVVSACPWLLMLLLVFNNDRRGTMAYFTNSLGYSYQHISSYCFCRRPFVHLFLFCLWFSRVYSGIAWSILINAGVWVGNDGGMMCVKFLVDWARLSYGYWHFLGSSSSSCCSSENVGREWYVIIIVCPYIYE